MEYLIDSCVWIDHLRPNTPDSIRKITHETVNRSWAVICEPVRFELLRLRVKAKRREVDERLSTLPMLQTPVELWRMATLLGERCRDAGVQAGFFDLLIAAIGLHHGATIVTFDRHFAFLQKTIGFQAEVLPRPA